MLLQNMQAEFAEAIFSRSELTGVKPSANIIIHYNNVISSIRETLKEIYPMIIKLVGEPFFNLTVKEYMKRYPSRSSNLHEYGEFYNDFLSEYQPLKNLIYLSEVAKFEWACHTLFFAPEHAGFDINALKQVPSDQYEQLIFTLHPASKLIKFHYPILRIIDLCTNETNEPININDGGINLLIIRRDLDISLVALNYSEFTFLSALDEGRPLKDALDLAMLIDKNFNLDEKLPAWISDKTIVDFKLD